MVLVACDVCRRRKLKCDGLRPRCSRCIKSDVTCVFDVADIRDTRARASRRENAQLREMVGTLSDTIKTIQHSPGRAADGRGQRAIDFPGPVASPPQAAGSVDATALRQPAPYPMFEAALPVTACFMELELHLSYPQAYPPLCVLDTSGHDLEPEQIPWLARHQIAEDLCNASSTVLPSPNERYGTVVPRMSPAEGQALMYDWRLNHLSIASWTNVPVSDATAAQAFSQYLYTDHPVLGLFDADLFLTDLVRPSQEFCNSLLVNALLFYALPETPNESLNLRRMCFEEAKLCRRAMEGSSSPLIVPALHLLATGCVNDGVYDEAEAFMSAAFEEARRLRLYGVESLVHLSATSDNPDTLRSVSHIAWGSFSCAILWGVFTQRVFLAQPPILPKLWENAHHISSGLNGGTAENIHLTGGSRTFAAISRMWVILGDVLQYRQHDGIDGNDVTFGTVESTYKRLLEWSAHLPEVLSYNSGMADHVTTLRIYYHLAVMELFRPFVAQNKRLHTFGAPDGSARAAFACSYRQLKRLVLLYRFNYPSAVTSLLWHGGVIFVANAAINYDTDADARLVFKHCIAAIANLLIRFSLMDGLLRGFLYMAVKKGVLSTAEAKAQLDMARRRAGRSAPADDRKIEIILDYDLALEDRSAARAERLVSGWEDMSLFEEFTATDMG